MTVVLIAARNLLGPFPHSGVREEFGDHAIAQGRAGRANSEALTLLQELKQDKKSELDLSRHVQLKDDKFTIFFCMCSLILASSPGISSSRPSSNCRKAGQSHDMLKICSWKLVVNGFSRPPSFLESM